MNQQGARAGDVTTGEDPTPSTFVLPALTEMTVKTHRPEKWRFVDLATGDVWMWVAPKDNYGTHFRRASSDEVCDRLRSLNG